MGVFDIINFIFLFSKGEKVYGSNKNWKIHSRLSQRKNMTQRQLADILEISDKTISKWECSGEKLSADDYQQNAEKNMMKNEYVYGIVYGPSFETAKNSNSQRRKAYAWKYLRVFLAASLVLVIVLFGSMLFRLSASFDFIVFLIIIIAAGLATIKRKKYTDAV